MRATSSSSAISRLSRSASADDGLEHQLLLVVVEPVPAVQQRRDEALDAGQRRAELVGDGRHEVGALPVEPGPTPARAQRDRHLPDRLLQRVPVQLRGDQHLGAVGQQPGLLGDRGPRGQALVGPVGPDPAVAVVVGHRQHELQRLPDRVALDTEHPDRGRRDQLDATARVGDDHTVRQRVDDLLRVHGTGHAVTLAQRGAADS